jgi:glycosyltransferase involved in cell wall biosynthesis
MLQEAAAYIPGWSDRAEVVNPGCDISLFGPAPRPKARPKVGFVGKLIASKGVHNLLAALPLVTHDHETVIVGYGGFAEELHSLAGALRRGDLDEARAIAERGEHGRLDDLGDFLASPPNDYGVAAQRLSISFTGRLEHGPLSKVLPTFDVLVVPSVVPEAFGMVAAEAAACGVLPIVPDHSGIGEAGAAVEEAIGRPGWLTYDPDDPVRGIAAALDRVLEASAAQRDQMEAAAVELARSRWSWDHVSERLLQLARQAP